MFIARSCCNSSDEELDKCLAIISLGQARLVLAAEGKPVGGGATLRAQRRAAVSFLTGQTGEEAVLGQLHSLAVGVGAGARGGAPRHLDL